MVYTSGKKLNKADKLGIHGKTEQICFNCFHLSIEAALTPQNRKLFLTEKLQIEIEVLKQLTRVEMELGIIKANFYIILQKNSKKFLVWPRVG